MTGAPSAAPSVLWMRPEDGARPEPDFEPPFFRDLNLDQIVGSVLAAWHDPALATFFHQPLRDVASVEYRQEVMRDLQQPDADAAVRAFTIAMDRVRSHLPKEDKHPYPFVAERSYLNAAAIYCNAVKVFGSALSDLPLASCALRGILEYLNRYVASEAFRTLAHDAESLDASLGEITYALILKYGSVTVLDDVDDGDYAAVVEGTFTAFRRGPAKDHRVEIPEATRMDHIQAQIVERVARLHPAPFRSLVAFPTAHPDFIDTGIARFDREVKFYLAYLDHVRRFAHTGLGFCFPTLSRASKETHVQNAFDLALAEKLIADGHTPVPNSVSMRDPERIIVVSGPNQGGKTTFARMIGQLHYLASLGCPIPGAEAHLFLCDQLFTHFEREESIETLRGKLQDDLVRVHRILEQATPGSLIIINEIFSSTALKDAVSLARKIVASISALDALAVCVTFLDELATLNEKTISVVAGVAPDDPATRTFVLERRPADGLAYALSIAEKHRVTYRWLKERLAS